MDGLASGRLESNQELKIRAQPASATLAAEPNKLVTWRHASDFFTSTRLLTTLIAHTWLEVLE